MLQKKSCFALIYSLRLVGEDQCKRKDASSFDQTQEKLFVFNFGEKENIYILILYFKKLYFKSFFGCSSVFGLILAVKGHTNTITHKIPPS